MPKYDAWQKPRTRYRRSDVTVEESIALATHKFGYEYRKVGHEGHGPCPFCPGGEDRFVLFDDGAGGYWCRQCGASGWVVDDDPLVLTKEELMERRVAALERKQQEMEERLTALERMARRECDVTRYHEGMNEEAVDWWHDIQGVSYESIARYKLGYCRSCPTAPGHDSFTIPYYDYDAGSLVNIRHRLARPNGTGKYRPHMAGLGIALFQPDALKADRTLLLEGEIKAIVLTQHGFPSVAVMGCKSFEPEWTARFGQETVIALDPDAYAASWDLAKTMRANGYKGKLSVARFPMKPDDCLVKHGATARDVVEILRLARPA